MKVPAKINADELVTLVSRLRNGDLTVVNTIVEGHVRLICHIAGRYGHRNKDEKIGVGLLAAVEAVRRAATNLTDNNITPFIVSAVHGAISRSIAHDRLVYVPQSTYARKGGDVTVPKPDSNFNISGLAKKDDPVEPLIMEELIDRACLTTMDRKIIEMRMHGYVDREIGQRFGLSTGSIAKMRWAIEQRLRSINGLAE